MANIYPIKEDLSEVPFAELKVYEALEKLGKNFYIFHSVQWLKKTKKWAATWKENDFLIINRNLGALVLEIKGGDIEYTGTVFHQINTQTEEVSVLDPKKKKDPLSQAIDGAYHYRRVFEKITKATETRMALDDRFPVEVAVWFPGCKIGEKMKKFPLAYREAEQAVLDLSSFDKGAQAIYDIFDFYGSREKVDITDDEFNKILEAIASDFELITAPAVKKDELDHAFLKLTQEQTGLLDYISEQRFATIQGVAGTGKTLIAKEAAKNFGEEGRKVLFLCFNKFLYVDLKKKYPYTNVTYYNIHSLISVYSNNTEDLSDASKRAEILEHISWDDLDFDDVIIDEAQDFHDREIVYFKEYAENTMSIIMFTTSQDENTQRIIANIPVKDRESAESYLKSLIPTFTGRKIESSFFHFNGKAYQSMTLPRLTFTGHFVRGIIKNRQAEDYVCCFYNDRLLIAPNDTCIQDYIHLVDNGKVKEGDVIFEECMAGLAPESACLLMTDMSKTITEPQLYGHLMPNFFFKNKDFFRNFLMTTQFTTANGTVFPSITLTYKGEL